MIVGDLAIVLAVLVAVAGLVARSVVRAQARTHQGPELAHAMRLLDQVLASDNAVPQLPTRLRAEVIKTVATYYKEIEA